MSEQNVLEKLTSSEAPKDVTEVSLNGSLSTANTDDKHKEETEQTNGFKEEDLNNLEAIAEFCKTLDAQTESPKKKCVKLDESCNNPNNNTSDYKYKQLDEEISNNEENTSRGCSSGYNVLRIQTFRPTWDEFQDFNEYVKYIESTGAHKAGICKVIPPPEWIPRKDGYNIDNFDFQINDPIIQSITETTTEGVYEQWGLKRRKLTVPNYQRLANSKKYCTPSHVNYKDLERIYWNSIQENKISPIYGSDVAASLIDVECISWNINTLRSILDHVFLDYNYNIDGVNTSFLYFGMWRTSFAWHLEDMDLYSINYIHFGEPKTWYGIPPAHARRFENLAKRIVPNFITCPGYFRHKISIISPEVLEENNIPYDVITQEEREIIITFPYGYHAGFNHGFNCAESANFATTRWIEYGKHVKHCNCREENVDIDMDTFVRNFQSDKYDAWKNGMDNGPHPEEPFADD